MKLNSIWFQDIVRPFFPSLLNKGSNHYDVAIVGGGITGLTAAYILKRRGKRVVVLDGRRIGSGASGLSTAHLSTSYDHGYQTLEKEYGLEGTRDFHRAMRSGIDLIAGIVRALGIDCDYKEVSGFQYAERSEQIEDNQREFESSKRAGLDVRIVNSLSPPFRASHAFEIKNQAQMNPANYLTTIAHNVHGSGSSVFESVHVDDFSENNNGCRLSLGDREIAADYVIFASHSPIGFSLIHSELSAKITSVIAFKCKDRIVPALFWDSERPYHYFRTAHTETGSVVIAGGEDYRTAHDGQENSFKRLEMFVRMRFEVEEIVGYWSGQYYDSVDHLPFIGKRPFSERMYIATGFSGDGMTLGSLAGSMIAGDILGEESRFKDLFNPSRIHLKNLGRLVSENADVAWCFIGDRLTYHSYFNELSLKEGQGAVYTRGLHKIAAYRDSKGELREFSAVCPHMKCIVRWNDVEQTFDCPCHGSRFDCAGKVLEGPSLHGLSPIHDEPMIKNFGTNELHTNT